MIKRLVLLGLLIAQVHVAAYPVEGMWIPLFLDSLLMRDMQAKGLRLSAEDIYSINHASIKDAVVIFGGGCTGEIISPDGLLITNHHCGDSRIHAHSTVENNLLENGFWALNREDELPNPGLTVTFLVRMEDVTEAVMKNVNETMGETERSRMILSNTDQVINEAIGDSHYLAEVKPFYFGSQYLLFVYEIFKDVRLVGAPPEAIGSFGGNTDNWVWPRHTGDFSLFRIYADTNNKPAEYSPDNIPYKPAKHLPISLKGIEEGDFTMVIGYPGSTDEYMLSRELQMIVEHCLPAKIQIRDLKLSVLENLMNQSEENKLKYSISFFGISNSWKKWIGVIRGINNTRAIEKKVALEKQFTSWIAQMTEKGSRYDGIIERFREFYDQYEPLYTAYDIGAEVLNRLETYSLVNYTMAATYIFPDTSGSARKEISQQFMALVRNYYRSNPIYMDWEILPQYLQIYHENTSAVLHPSFYTEVRDRFHGDYHAFVDDIHYRSLFADTVKLFRLLKRRPDVVIKKIAGDPLYQLYYQFNKTLTENVYQELNNLSPEHDRLYRIYLDGLMEMDPARRYYPDANFTMRITYGNVEGYKPSDAVEYNYYTTLKGVFEKEDPDVEDYFVPQSLKEIYYSGNYGQYIAGQQVPVCFIASNHTSGGNSGSPVLNADGHLIGINFDRNWEGTMSDYAYDPEICRNISLDIRYVLFILDKLAHAEKILNELTIIE